MNSIAVIIPAYNEQDNIVKLVNKIKDLLPRSSIYIIDDSPGNQTNFIINKKNLIIIIEKKIRQGFSYSLWNKKSNFS